MENTTDLILAGCGPVSRLSALMAHDLGLSLAWLSPQNPPADGRLLALSPRSVAILRRLGVWPRIEGTALTAIDEVRIVHGAQTINLSAQEFGLTALGYSVPHSALMAALDIMADERGLRPEIGARLVSAQTHHELVVSQWDGETGKRTVQGKALILGIGTIGDESAQAQPPEQPIPATNQTAARSMINALRWQALSFWVNGDGASFSDMGRAPKATIKYAYPQKGWMFNAVHPHLKPRCAIECFSEQGVVAVIPGTNDEFKVILFSENLPENEDEATQSLSQNLLEHLTQSLSVSMPSLAEGWQMISPPRLFRPQLIAKTSAVEGRTVWLGNSAQTMSPVGGQGLNTGIFDVWSLFMAFREYGVSAKALQDFERTRSAHTPTTLMATHAMSQAHHYPHRLTDFLARRVARSPLLKQNLAKTLMFG